MPLETPFTPAHAEWNMTAAKDAVLDAVRAAEDELHQALWDNEQASCDDAIAFRHIVEALDRWKDASRIYLGALNAAGLYDKVTDTLAELSKHDKDR